MSHIGDVYEPLPLYRDEFSGKFRENAEAFFNALAEKSGVDRSANIALVAQIRKVEKKHVQAQKVCMAWRCGAWLAGIAAVLLALWFFAILSGYVGEIAGSESMLVGLGGGVALLLTLLFSCILPGLRRAGEKVNALAASIASLKDIAWKQMEPLNALFDWDAAARIIEQTVPRLKFDPFFTQERLSELHSQFGWSDEFNSGKSVLGAQSGEINGNPFVFGRLLKMEWGSRTYTGTRVVSWTEHERDPSGRSRSVVRYQTLVASVTKPIPEYSEDCFLIYGNDAAPNLIFTRNPTSLSSSSAGFVGRLRMKNRIRSLEKFSRNLDDDHGYTILGNREFEALFVTKDRSDEVEYRLLFTPLAQKQMLEILKDKSVGYGDDFSFLKSRKINIIRAKHLDKANLDTNPKNFIGYEYDEIHRNFITFCCDYFKNTYFALAPLLAIPLYQQTRTHVDIYRDVLKPRASFWEHEALANFMGEKRFSHPLSETRNILKASATGRDGDCAKVSVAAHGFRTVTHTDSIPVCARNGRVYMVNVEWKEYLPVVRTSEINAEEHIGLTRPVFTQSAMQDVISRSFRRSIVAWQSNSSDG